MSIFSRIKPYNSLDENVAAQSSDIAANNLNRLRKEGITYHRAETDKLVPYGMTYILPASLCKIKLDSKKGRKRYENILTDIIHHAKKTIVNDPQWDERVRHVHFDNLTFEGNENAMDKLTSVAQVILNDYVASKKVLARKVKSIEPAATEHDFIPKVMGVCAVAGWALGGWDITAGLIGLVPGFLMGVAPKPIHSHLERKLEHNYKKIKQYEELIISLASSRSMTL